MLSSIGIASTLFFRIVVTTNVTNESQMTGWTAEPNARGTIGLLWSCLSTLIICTWTVQHLSLPAEKRSNTATQVVLRKLKWTFCTLICPEYLAGHAFVEYMNVRRHIRRFNKTSLDGSAERWTMSQGFYISSGGLLVSCSSSQSVNKPEDSGTHQLLPNLSSAKAPAQVTLTLEGTYSLIQQGLIVPSSLPDISIQDKNKANGLAKFLACIQSGWLLLQCIGRKNQHLPISVLEFSCLAYVALTYLVYGFWWNKPVDVETPTTISTIPYELDHWTESVDYLTDRDLLGSASDDRGYYTLIFVGAIFGAWHALAWNLTFPTAAEQTLWRATSISSIATPVAWGIYTFVDILVGRPTHALDYYLSPNKTIIFLWALVLPYFIARLFMVVEMFASLRSMPAGVYQTVKWADYMPHI